MSKSNADSVLITAGLSVLTITADTLSASKACFMAIESKLVPLNSLKQSGCELESLTGIITKLDNCDLLISLLWSAKIILLVRYSRRLSRVRFSPCCL